MKKNKSKKPIGDNKFHLSIQCKYRTLVVENKKAYKRSRDKKVTYEE